MADEVEIVRNSVDVLGQVFALRTTFSAVSNIISFSGLLAAAFPVIGAILGLIGAFLPDGKHQQIHVLKSFDELSYNINLVRDDTRELGKTIQWEFTELNYGRDVAHIELGIEYCIEIERRSGKEEKKWFQDKLRDHCHGESCSFAMRNIFDGMLGTGAFGGSSILDRFYVKTGGDRPRISALASRLLKVIHGGMMVISTYDTMMLGKKGAADVTKPFDRRLNETCNKVNSVLNECVQNFGVNMLNDLNKKLDQGGSNRDLVHQISELMRNKYDWLENFSLVYNDLRGFDKHCIGGYYVHSFHRNGKCGVVFYRIKAEPPKFSNRYNEAYKINHETGCANARDGYNNMAANLAKLRNKGIEWSGLAVIRTGSDLHYTGTFSTRDATITGRRATAIILLK